MKKIVLFCLLTCACIYMQAQVNYVLNPSFEGYSKCPNDFDQIKYAYYWQPIDSVGAYPTGPLCAPEYCNACDTPTASVGIPPVNVPGCPGGLYYHYARTGSGMAEVLMYNSGIGLAGEGPYQRDYMQGHLYKPLAAGKSYCVTFYVALEQLSGYAINHIGAYLDDGSIDKGQDSLGCAGPQTAYTPQVLEDSIIIDTLGWSFANDSPTYDRTWAKIQESFTATGTERFITIGNFFDTAHTNTVALPLFSPWDGGGGPRVWYLVDDVSVIESDNVPEAGNDTSIAKGDSVFLGPHEIALPYMWYKLGNPVPIDSGGGIWVKPDTITTYVLEQNLCGLLSYDTVNVNVLPKKNNVVNVGNVRNVVVYPNPAGNVVNVENVIGGEVRIFDVVGQEVFYAKLNSNKQQLDISKLVTGTYLLQVIASDGSRVNKVIEKER